MIREGSHSELDSGMGLEEMVLEETGLEEMGLELEWWWAMRTLARTLRRMRHTQHQLPRRRLRCKHSKIHPGSPQTEMGLEEMALEETGLAARLGLWCLCRRPSSSRKSTMNLGVPP